MASAACKKPDGVPVELNVATIFWAMMALFPIPVTITRPFDPKIRAMQLKKSESTDFVKFAIAADSSVIVLIATAFNPRVFFKAQFFKNICLIPIDYTYICI